MESQGEGQHGQAGGPAPGWYPDANGQTRWWDGTQWGQLAAPASPVPTGYGAPQPTAGSATDPRTMAMLAHLLGIFTGFVGPLVIYLINGDKDPFVRHHASEALNFQITVMIAYVACFVLMFVLIGFLLFFVVWIGALVYMIIGAVQANKGEWWRYPINIRMVSGAVG